MKLLNILFRFIFSRTTIFIVAILFQIYVYAGLYMFFYEYLAYFYILFVIIGFITIIELLNDEQNPMFKISWILLILSFPVFGILTYILLNYQITAKEMKKRIINRKKYEKKFLIQDDDVLRKIDSKKIYNLTSYLYNHGGYPAYEGGITKYYNSGELWFKDYIKYLKDAKEYIFMEYFIIGYGKFWDTVLEVLKDKVKEGVEVYILYDGTCEISLLPHNFSKIMQSFGIKCKPFYKVIPLLSTYQNNRDHRKITVIDGKVAFVGGTNISDEYINEYKRFGYWKDATIRVEGKAVKTFTTLFLSMWEVDEKKNIDYNKYVRENEDNDNGIVVPFGDIPHDGEEVSKKVYMDLINRTNDKVSIMTPYLILDYEFLSALKYAAQRGVEVNLIIPHIPDKWYVYILARSYYHELLSAGINIYEFTPGFVHSKVIVSDKDEAVVGSINLDYRSFYLHFEAGIYLYNNSEIVNITKDIEETIKVSNKITIEENKKYNKFKKVLGRIFRLFAPLM